MPNPMLTSRRCARRPQTWAPPQPGTDYIPPITDGPSALAAGVMTVNGTIAATAVLFVLLLVSATVGWIAADGPDARVDGERQLQFPALAWVGHLRRLRA